MSFSLWIDVGLGLFMTAWLVTIIGWATHVVEWRRFRRGHMAAARRGPVLSSLILPAWVSDAESLAGVGGGRWAGSNILLFPLRLPYASSSSCSVFWFGRAVVGRDHVSIEARVPWGLVMFVSGWFVCAFLMTVILCAAGAPFIALTAIGIATVAAMSYRNNVRREREAAERFVETFARRLGTAA